MKYKEIITHPTKILLWKKRTHRVAFATILIWWLLCNDNVQQWIENYRFERNFIKSHKNHIEHIQWKWRDCTHIKRFNDAFRYARDLGDSHFIWQDQQWFIDLYTTEYKEERYPEITTIHDGIHNWIEDFFQRWTIVWELSKISKIPKDSIKILLHARNNANLDKETITMGDSRQRANNLLELYTKQSFKEWYYNILSWKLYAEYTRNKASYLHEKLHKVDFPTPPIPKLTDHYDTKALIQEQITHALSNRDMLKKTLLWLIDRKVQIAIQKKSSWHAEHYDKKHKKYILQPDELFVRFFSLFYYWEMYTNDRWEHIRVDLRLLEQAVRMTWSSTDCLEFLALCDKEKVVALMNRFYDPLPFWITNNNE